MRPGHWIAIDGMAGAVLALACVLTGTNRLGVYGPGPLGVNGIGSLVRTLLPVALAAAIFFSVTLRRRKPVAAFCALILLSIVSVEERPITTLLILLATAYVLYLTTVASSKRTGFAALTLALIVIAMLLFTYPGPIPNGSGNGMYVPVAFAMIISWMTGYSVRQRRAYAAMLQYQAASSAVAEERLRIARELHDIVAHSMSVIAVQAGYGQYVIDTSPSDARNALGAIQATSRDALEEMRRMLGVLRQQDAVAGSGATVAGSRATVAGSGAAAGPSGAPEGTGAAGTGSGPGDDSASPLAGILGFLASGSPPQSVAANSSVAPGPSAARSPAGSPVGSPVAPLAPAPLAPAPGLGDLDRLIQRTSGTGIRVALQRTGHIRAVPAGVDLSAYRIIQEALTNVVKHAGADARCEVSIGYGDDAIEVRVTDDGGRSPVPVPAGATPAPSSGHGLIGMRERVHLCGGEFSAGPLEPGGFQVAATLPLRGGDQ
jgi:signal transduction histidine kinase